MAPSDTDPQDRQWLAGWRRNDPEAGRSLYTRYGKSITRFFTSRVHKDDVDQLVQETFLTLQRTGGEVEETVRAYLYGVARNELRHYIRAAKRRSDNQQKLERALDEGTLTAFDITASDPEARLGEKVEHRFIRKVLRRLSLDDQALLELTYWEGLSRSEIAAILGAKEGTIASRIAAARRHLAAKMAELAGSLDLLESTSKSTRTWLAELVPHIEHMRRREAERQTKPP